MNLRMQLLETAEQLSSAIKRQDHKQRASRERTYRALRRELDAAMKILEFECKHQESQIGTATETIRYTEQLYSKGYISSDQVTAEKAKLETLRSELEKLRAVVELYHQVREESESMIREATKGNTQPSDPNTGDPTDGGTAAEGTNEASFESSDATGREFDSGTTAEGVQDDSTSRPDSAPPGDNF